MVYKESKKANKSIVKAVIEEGRSKVYAERFVRSANKEARRQRHYTNIYDFMGDFHYEGNGKWMGDTPAGRQLRRDK